MIPANNQERSEEISFKGEARPSGRLVGATLWFDRVTRWALFAIGFLLPIAVISEGGIELSRATIFGILVLIACGAELIKILLAGTFSYVPSALHWAIGAFLLVLGVSTYVSPVSSVAFLGSDLLAERFMSIITFVLIYALVIVSMRNTNDILLFALSLIGGSALWGIVSFLGFFGVHMPFIRLSDANGIGTLNALALFFAFLAMLTAGLVLGFRKNMPSLSIFLRAGLWFSLGIFFLNLVIINFLNAWIILFLSSVVLAWMHLKMAGEGEGRGLFHDTYAYLLIALLCVPFLFIFIQVPLFSGIQIPSEASPSFNATLDIAKKSFSQNTRQVLLGTGPGTFGYVYSAFKDPAINATDFWGVRFGQGYSLLSTVLATTGILGFLAYVGVCITACVSIGRMIIRRRSEHPFLYGYVSGSAVLLLAWILYPATYSLLLALFAMLGFCVVIVANGEGNTRVRGDAGDVSARTSPDSGESGFCGERRVEWHMPWAVFASSLLIVFLFAFVIAGIFAHVQRYRAALSLESAIIQLQQKGNIEDGLLNLRQATDADTFNDQYNRFLVQGRMLAIQNIVSSVPGEAPSAAIQERFQREVSAAIDAVKRSLQINPLESFNWRTAGSLYEMLIPFVSGADQSAVSAYAQAAVLDPINPAVFVEIGRTYITIADVAQKLMQQEGNSREQATVFAGTRVKALESAVQALQKAIGLKNDLASAHFLLAQVALRQGNARAAIESTERAQQAAPGNIGMLFQLGLLYYQNNQLSKAEDMFSRALALNEQYSNARYFLGLILDRKGQTEEAIRHFERIDELNPENQDVKKILENLRSGKPALSAVISSGKEVPIREKGGKEQTPIHARSKKK